jgi:SRSO17 transposase
VIDETGFLKQGQHSCGVGRQYTGSAGKITCCQIGVFATYISDKGCAFIDRQLYLPQDWTNKPERRTAAPLPNRLHFVTKPQIATQMVERAIAAGVPFDWVATDTVYGVGKVEMQLRRAGKVRICAGRTCHRSVLILDRQTRSGRHGREDCAGSCAQGLDAPV